MDLGTFFKPGVRYVQLKGSSDKSQFSSDTAVYFIGEMLTIKQKT